MTVTLSKITASGELTQLPISISPEVKDPPALGLPDPPLTTLLALVGLE